MPFHELISTEWDSQLSKFLLWNSQQSRAIDQQSLIALHYKPLENNQMHIATTTQNSIRNNKQKMNVHCSCFILFNAVYKWNYRIYYHQFVRGPLLRDICIIGKGWMKRVVEPSKGCGVILQHFSQHNKTCLYPQPTMIKSVTFIHSFHLPLHQAATENMKIKHFHILP